MLAIEKKRIRSKNYTDCDRVNLLEITSNYLNIIENKKSDGITIKAKNLAWEKIARQFNKISQTGERTAMQLKQLYESIKKRYRFELNCKNHEDIISISNVFRKYEEIIERHSNESNMHNKLELFDETIRFIKTNIHDNSQQSNETVDEKDPLSSISENSKDSVENENSNNIKDIEIETVQSVEVDDGENTSSSSQIKTKRKEFADNDDEKEQLKLEILRIRKEKEEIERDILLLKKRELEMAIEEKVKKLRRNEL